VATTEETGTTSSCLFKQQCAMASPLNWAKISHTKQCTWPSTWLMAGSCTKSCSNLVSCGFKPQVMLLNIHFFGMFLSYISIFSSSIPTFSLVKLNFLSLIPTYFCWNFSKHLKFLEHNFFIMYDKKHLYPNSIRLLMTPNFWVD
jgi:hypothetical protein